MILPPPPEKQPLTDRELQVLRLLAKSQTNRAIAYKFGRSINTINNHVQHILRKLGVANRTEAACWAVRSGYADGEDATPTGDPQ